MALFLSEADIRHLVSMADAIEAIREIFRLDGEELVINPPRQCVNLAKGSLRVTSAAVPCMSRMAVKVSSTLIFKRSSGRLLCLLDSESGEILALMEVFRLGALRTGAATGVATDALARSDAKQVGLFGSGRQARTQLLAVTSVRKVERTIAFSPNRVHLEQFCREMEENLGIQVVAAQSPEELYESDVLISATTSKEPVILGKNLRPGMHLNAIGANTLERRELDDEAVARCTLIAVDNKEQAKHEAAELVGAVEQKRLSWGSVSELGAILAGKEQGRLDSQAITLYKSHGVAMEDVALAVRAYELAVKHEVGLEIPLTKS